MDSVSSKDEILLDTVHMSEKTSFLLGSESTVKLWKTTFMLLTVPVLPLALVAVGNAQQLTCWYLKPSENKGPTSLKCSRQTLDARCKDMDTNTDADQLRNVNEPPCGIVASEPRQPLSDVNQEIEELFQSMENSLNLFVNA
jgi:hypothetical protein